MRSLDPACKFVGLLVSTFVLASTRSPVLNLAAFLLAMALILASRTRPRTLGLLLIPILLAAAGMFFTGYRFAANSSMPVRAEAFLGGKSALWNGLIQASRVLAYAGLGFLFALTTDRVAMVRSFRKRFRLPQVFAYGLLAAWGVFPQMAREYRRTRAAFRARGLRPFALSPSLLAPLLVKSVRWSEELSIAMESKGFEGRAERSELDPPRFRARDAIFLAVTCLTFPAAAYALGHVGLI